MRYISLFLLLMISTILSNAQVFSENFNATTGTALPAGWTQKNLDNFTVNNGLSTLNFGSNAWIARNFSATPTERFVASTSWYSAVQTSNDWIVTPQINMPATLHNFLVFKSTAVDPQYKDGFVVKVSTTDTQVASFTNTILTVPAENVGWTTHAIDLSAYAGMSIYIAFINNSTDKYLLYLDDVEINTLPMSDAAISNITPVAGTRPAHVSTSGGSASVKGTITNYGYQNITSATIKYNDGTNTYSYNATGLNVAPYASYDFTHTTPVTFAAQGAKNYKVWVEVASDSDNSNDTATTKLVGVGAYPKYNITFEEGTGTWCGWCPRGAVYMDSMSELHHDDVSLIAVHNGDPMTVANYDAGLGGLIGGYPSCMANREDEIDPSEMITYYDDHKNDFGFANITANGSFNTSNMLFTVNASVTPSLDLNGDYRIALVMTEDNVTGTASGYNQANYYAANGIDLTNDGMNWKNLANPVPAASMVYDHVARVITGGFDGQASSLPASMMSGTAYNATASWTVPSVAGAGNFQGYILLIDATNHFIMNSSGRVAVALNTKDLTSNINSLVTYPNPVKGVLHANLELKSATDATYSITNALGQVVLNGQLNNLNSGNNNFTVVTNTLSAGKYYFTVETKEGKISNKFVVE